MAPATNMISLSVILFLDLFRGILSLDISQLDFNQTLILPSGETNRKAALLFPLFRTPSRLSSSSSQSSAAAVVDDMRLSRRHLQSRRLNNSRMSLHDDLLLNGYYTTRLWIGTPPQRFALIVDTGSTVTYVPCSSCEQCGKHQDPRFEPELSSSYKSVKCNIDCTCDNDGEHCTYERQYAEMSSSSGILGEDIVSFGNLSEVTPQRAVFGCETMETGDLYSQHADGIMGLGRGDLSIVDQLVDKKVISDSFSLCYGGMDIGGGAMVLGGISPPEDMVYSRSDPNRSPYYNIELKEIRVAGKALHLDHLIFDRKHGTVLDSGTTYAYLPEEAFLAFKSAIMEELDSLKQIQGPDPSFNDICFSGAGSDVSELSKIFPSVDMVFGDGHRLSLSPENYLFRHSKVRGAYCLGIFQNGKDPTTLLGGIIVRNTLVTYDREHEKIGFWKTNCSDLWNRLQTSSAPPPLPSSLNNNTNSTDDVAPTLAPSESPVFNASGGTRVGLVTFYMSLSVNYSDLKPHVSELSKIIAKELNVDISQVHLTNFTSDGNVSITKWAIFPAGSADFFPNATATKIISRLAKNDFHLPDTFGSYKTFDWKTESSPRGTWWQQHYLVVLIAFLIALIIVLSMFGALLIWRKREQSSVVSYKPVDSAVAEQELQPLN